MLPPSPNPFGSLLPLASGTCANDLYRRNAWLAAYVCPAEAAAQERRRKRRCVVM